MPNRFFETAFTPSVQAEQSRHGSREAYAKHAGCDGPERGRLLSTEEIAFIEARDSFYLATVSETGWPHVQHRGGPAGFVRAIDRRTLGWADYSGNRQYVSIGNISRNERAAMIFVDYPARLRLKVLGTMRSSEAGDRPDLGDILATPGYRARIEHFVEIRVEAFDWNCPQHITERYTKAEIAAGRAAGEPVRGS